MWTEQSPDSAKVKEGLHRLQKRLRAEKKVVDEKEKKYKEQQQHIAKLHADLKRITDGKLSHVRFMTHVERVSRLLSTLRSVMLSAKDMVFYRAAQEELDICVTARLEQPLVSFALWHQFLQGASTMFCR